MAVKKLTDKNFLPPKGSKAIPVYACHFNDMYDAGAEVDAKISVLNRRDHHSMDATHIIKHPLLAVAVYDFSVDGGATGTVNLNSAVGMIPDNAIVRNVFYDIQSTLVTNATAGTATMVFQLPTDGTLVSILVPTGSAATGGATGTALGTPLNASAGTWIKTTAARAVQVDITGASAITAGKVYCFVEYVTSELDAADYVDTGYATFD